MIQRIMMRLPIFSFAQDLKKCFLFLLLGCAWIIAGPAQAAVNAGTISFSGTSGNTVTDTYNGLGFSQGSGWLYDSGFGGNGTIFITPVAGTSGDPGIIKVMIASDRFNLISLKGIGYGGDANITITAYRSGALVDTQTLMSNGASFSTKTVNMTNIDELRIYNGDGYLSIDDLVVEPYIAPLSLAPTTLSAATVGTAYGQTITASNGTAPYSYAVTTGSLPAGINLSGAGVLSGTPTAGGSFSFTVTATDSAATPATGSQAYNLTVNAPTLTFSPSTLTVGTVGTAYSQNISVSGGTSPYNTFAVASGALPAGLSLNASTGLISGTPTAVGVSNFTVSAQDSSTGTGPYSGTSTTISLTIGAPTISLSPASLPAGTVGTAYSQTITASGGTAPHTFAITAGALPAGLSLSGAGTLSGTPTAGGSFNFTVTATDSSSGSGPFTGSRAYTLTVAAPTISLSPASLPAGTAGTAYSQTITASGGTAPHTFAITAGALPAGLSLSSAGTLSGTPTASGSFNFTVTATDSSSGSGPFTGNRAYALAISVQAPIANAVSATVAYNSSNNPIPLNITGGAATSVAVASAASHGTATASGTSITYTPTVGYAGSDSFTYTATNAGGTSAAATVTITVSPGHTITTIASPNAGGTVTCNPNPVPHGTTSTCTATANTGYTFSVFSGDCTGTTCVLSNVTSAKSVTGNFVTSTTQPNIPTTTTGVTATLSASGCSAVDQAVFITPPAGASSTISFPFGLLDFTLSGCASTATITVTYSRNLPSGASFYKVRNGAYAIYPAILGTNSVTFTLADNDAWDGDATLGIIKDPGGIGISSATSIPTLSEWGLITLSGIMALFGFAQFHRRSNVPL